MSQSQNSQAPARPDPTDDAMYKGLSLETFLKHFAPQEAALREEVAEISEKKYLPFADPTMPEIAAKSRTELRNIKRKQQKELEKTVNIEKRVLRLMRNPLQLDKILIAEPHLSTVVDRLKKRYGWQ